MKAVSLFNTASRSVEELRPMSPDQVTIYTCGPTVYGDAHIGNFRSYVFEDVLVRVLNHFGYVTRRVMNITDVGHLTSDADEGEDKLEVGAKRDGITAWEVAKRYEKKFLEDSDLLRLKRPDEIVRATDTIAEQIKLVQTLEEKGYTYRIDDGIYFDAAKFPDYGKMAHLNLEGQQAGARVEQNEQKRSSHDFALWKLSPTGTKRDMEWESPWGIGFPGWHIECSAIAMKTLGEQIDIHCGGIDHIPVHHTNEIAQSEAATGKKPFAQIWLHNDFLVVDGGKMSKSRGTNFTLVDLKEHGIDPLAFKYFLYGAVYRAKLNFTWESAKAAQTAWDRLRAQVAALGEAEEKTDISEIETALSDDLNTPQALAAFWELMKSDKSAVQKRWAARQMDEMLALGLTDPIVVEPIPAEATALLEARNRARAQKDWTLADQLREQLTATGYDIEDTPSGSLLTKIKI